MLRAQLVVIWLVACTESSSTALEGNVACGSTMCSTGQICKHQGQGVDAGTGIAATCVSVPTGCRVFDCMGTTCSDCVLDLCADDSNVSVRAGAQLTGRDLSCPGQ